MPQEIIQKLPVKFVGTSGRAPEEISKEIVRVNPLRIIRNSLKDLSEEDILKCLSTYE